MRPPAERLAEEWFWQAAANLQARGLCVVDQVAGVVTRGTSRAARYQYESKCRQFGVEPVPEEASPRRFPARDLRARCEVLVSRWRHAARRGGGEGSVYGQCAIDLEEVLVETKGVVDPDRRDAVAGFMEAHRPLAEVMCESGAPLAGLSLSMERIVQAAVDEIRASRAKEGTPA